MKKAITEEMNLQEEWYKEAHGMTLEKLPEFLRKLSEDYGHDYGTICNSMVAGALATCWALDKGPSGGITGYQAGCIMWGFLRQWNYSHNKTGLRIIDYDNFLYPQYEHEYEKTISKDIWAGIQKEAGARIEKYKSEYLKYLEALDVFKKDISVFVEKYPDYYERKEHYDPLGMGTGDQWDAEEKKKASGFKFAPQSPYEPVRSDSDLHTHLESIVAGNIPFGYSLKKE